MGFGLSTSTDHTARDSMLTGLAIAALDILNTLPEHIPTFEEVYLAVRVGAFSCVLFYLANKGIKYKRGDNGK